MNNQFLKILAKLISLQQNDKLISYIASLLINTPVQLHKEITEIGEYNLVIQRGTSDLAFVAHLDVIPANKANWRTTPFTLTKSKMLLTGRGVCDNKTHVALLLDLIISDSTLNFYIVLTSEEEVALTGIKAAKLPRHIKNVIVLEPTSNNLVLSHPGVSGILTTFKGKTGHASESVLTENCIWKLGQFISSIKVPEKSTINLGLINGGEKLNVIPSSCSLKVNYRYFETTPQEWLNTCTNNTPDTTEIIFDFPAFNSTVQKSFITKLIKLGINGTNKEAKFYSEAAILESNSFPSVVWGIGDIKFAHTINECISVKDVVLGKKIIRNILRNNN